MGDNINYLNKNFKLTEILSIIKKLCKPYNDSIFLFRKNLCGKHGIKNNAENYEHIESFDYTNLYSDYQNWQIYVLKRIDNYVDYSIFLQIIFCAQLDLEIGQRSVKDTYNKAINIMNSSRGYTCIKLLRNKFLDSSIIMGISHSSIAHNELILQLLFYANIFFLDLLCIPSDDLFNELSQLLKEKGISSFNFIKSSNHGAIKLLLACYLCIFNIDSTTTINLINNIDKHRINIFNDFNNGFLKRILDNNSILGASGYLEMQYYGNSYINKETRYENIINDIDNETLLICADMFYYNIINTEDHDSLYKSYLCSKEAYDRGNLQMAAFNLASHHYYLSTSYKDDSGKFALLQKEITPSLSRAISLFIESASNGHYAAFNSLGNISYKLKSLKEHKEEENLLINFAKEIYNLSHLDDESLYLELQYVFYKKASEGKNLDGTYNYCRILEKILINEASILSKKEALKSLHDNLVLLYHYKHPKGMNLFCQYYLFFLSKQKIYDDNTGENIFSMFLDENTDFIPDLYKDKCIKFNYINFTKEELGWKSSGRETINHIIKDLKYVCHYTINQLFYFWPAYHYCLLETEFNNNINSSTAHDINKILIKILSNKNYFINEGFNNKDSHQLGLIYNILLKNTVKHCSELECQRVFIEFSEDIENYINSTSYPLNSSIKRNMKLLSKKQNKETPELELLNQYHNLIQKYADKIKDLEEENDRLKLNLKIHL